jgi:O-antigen/teichoic acid export membrane protein
LLSDREQDLEKILRPFFGYALLILIPAALFFESFSNELIEVWLGPSLLNAGQMLPTIFIAFAVYYLTETLYKAIQGSGLSFYSGAVQIASIFIQIGVFALLASKPLWSVPISILAGFLFFSVTNFLMFKRHFRKITLIRSNQLLWVMIPACSYILVQFLTSRNLWPFLFSAYVIIHLFCVRSAKIFDWIGIARDFVSLKARQRASY